MKSSNINIFCACVFFVLVTPAYNAPRPRSKGHSSSIKHDQQQSGDYNIQVHLKDFHIVAVLGDGSWGNYGDYDYNYDYSDLTIKPIVSITTSNPQDSSTTEAPSPETQKPNDHPYPIVSPSTTLQEAPSPATQKPDDHPYPIVSPSTTLQGAPSHATQKPDDHPYPIVSPSTTLQPSEQPSKASNSPSTAAGSKTTSAPSSSTAKQQQNSESPKVTTTTTKGAPTTKRPESQPTKGSKKEPAPQVVYVTESPVTGQDSSTEKKSESPVTNISIVPLENLGAATTTEKVPLGEIMHYRKCADGYTRDKQGRCRRIRRTPQIPFGITRLASNLASRFRQATSGESTL